MKKKIIAAGAALLLVFSSPALAAPSPLLTVNGTALGAEAMATLYYETTYVSLRTVSECLDSRAVVTWEDGVAWVRSENLTLSAQPGSSYLTINGTDIPVPSGVKLSQGRTLVPIRALAQAFGASVSWNAKTGEVAVTKNVDAPSPSYSENDLYWLSRIISAESQGEPLEGKIAVGNVVLNRVASSEFPDTIYGVIFDSRWGGQFEPVRNGTIYHAPTEESITAARLCLEGTNIAGNSLYFIAPSLAQNFWVPNNRKYVMTIGCHEFYL